MKDDRASRTAMAVAFWRAIADAGATHVRGFRDPTARPLLDGKWLVRYAMVEDALRKGKTNMYVAVATVAADLMALRTAVIDAAVQRSVAAGAKQLVILGAGFDGRAWRMPELADVRVFEVDHPATQVVKRERVGSLTRAASEVKFVAVNFERDSLDAALDSAGHERGQPTCWIWEGVVMYLTPEVMRATLARIAARSAPGSMLIINYHTTLRRGLVGLLLRLIREPFRGKWTPAEMATDLRTAGFVVEEDVGLEDAAARYATGPVNLRSGRSMRVVVATRMSR